MHANIAISNLMQSPALNAADEEIGRVKDVLIDQTGSVTAFVLELGGVMGVGARLAYVPFAQCQISSDARGPKGRLPGLKQGEVLIASALDTGEDERIHRIKDRFESLSQVAISKAAQAGQAVSQTAVDLAKRAANASAALTEAPAGAPHPTGAEPASDQQTKEQDPAERP